MRRTIFLLILLLLMVSPVNAQAVLDLEDIVLPDGFEINIFADDVPNARSITIGSEGTVFVGSRIANTVYALRDNDADFRVDEMLIIASNLNVPNGLAFHDGSLYVAEIHRIIRYDDIEQHLDNPPQAIVVYDDLPNERNHGWRYLRIGADDKLYLGIGAPCNVCESEAPFGTIARLNLDGSDFEILAHGVRNTVGFDWHPQTGDLWFTDNGRDWVSDDLPPDELNHISEIGQHFGFPYCHGGFLPDIDFGSEGICEQYTAPAQNLGPHVASLGMRFYTGEMFPEEYQGQIFIAEHGSWNRISSRIGYRITLVRLDDEGQAISYETFATGWLNDRSQEFSGRPVDIEIMPDGSMLVSDDAASKIYRISYQGD